MTAVYGEVGKYSDSDGISNSALAIWAILRKHLDNSDHPVPDRIVELLKGACFVCFLYSLFFLSFQQGTPNEMGVLFYWLSTTCALLHMIRDEPDAPSNNDRDPIIGTVILHWCC